MSNGGIWPKQNSFHPTEYRGIGADSQSQTENRQRGKAWTAPQLPKAIPEVLDKILQQASAAGISALLFDLRDAAQGDCSGPPSLVGRHSLCNVLADLLVEMLAKLCFHFLVRLTGMEQGTQSKGQGKEPLLKIHVQASLSLTTLEIAAETRFQLAVSFSRCFRPKRV